ncbi:MAG: ferritin family protein [Candidatus Jettenia sp. CY-1]|nr:MAG: ferritin family protein [Candidatus Jettenia sp. CY-1]
MVFLSFTTGREQITTERSRTSWKRIPIQEIPITELKSLALRDYPWYVVNRPYLLIQKGVRMKISYTSEPSSIMEILMEAIKREQESYDYYYRAALQAAKPATRKLLLNLADWEKGHIEELTNHVMELKAQMEIDRAMTGGL